MKLFMENKDEILKQLRAVRLQSALTTNEEEKKRLTEQANMLHKAYSKNLFEEISNEKQKGR